MRLGLIAALFCGPLIPRSGLASDVQRASPVLSMAARPTPLAVTSRPMHETDLLGRLGRKASLTALSSALCIGAAATANAVSLDVVPRHQPGIGGATLAARAIRLVTLAASREWLARCRAPYSNGFDRRPA